MENNKEESIVRASYCLRLGCEERFHVDAKADSFRFPQLHTIKIYSELMESIECFQWIKYNTLSKLRHNIFYVFLNYRHSMVRHTRFQILKYLILSGLKCRTIMFKKDLQMCWMGGKETGLLDMISEFPSIPRPPPCVSRNFTFDIVITIENASRFGRFLKSQYSHKWSQQKNEWEKSYCKKHCLMYCQG